MVNHDGEEGTYGPVSIMSMLTWRFPFQALHHRLPQPRDGPEVLVPKAQARTRELLYPLLEVRFMNIDRDAIILTVLLDEI